ncbi:alcohol dehydrogenase [Bactrocera dorsalis]|uniref:Alcohol dehydrogenase n=1 Tax=Bactrocera dorsalis TaxID=27457 RepID=A0ABM3K7F4_BACDO|nr:alcohol dehydrogenase [Bactrocera dorsalis]
MECCQMDINMDEVGFDLNGKNVIYIGGFGGIGLNTCKQLVQKGVANLMILDQVWNESAFNEINVVDTKHVCQFMAFDVTCGLEETRAIFTRIVEKFGHIDVLINGAGIADERDFDLIIATNFTATINATLVAYDLMDKSKGGKGGVVLNIASVAALTPFPSLPIYSATKGGILNFTRALALLEPKTGIKLYTICPGPTSTKHFEDVHCFLGKNLIVSERLRRLVKPQLPADCAMNIVKAMETNANGATWLCDMGQLKLVEIKNFWTPPHKRNKEAEQKKGSEPNKEAEQNKETERTKELEQNEKTSQTAETVQKGETSQKEASAEQAKATVRNPTEQVTAEKKTDETMPLRKRRYLICDLGRDMQNICKT